VDVLRLGFPVKLLAVDSALVDDFADDFAVDVLRLGFPDKLLAESFTIFGFLVLLTLLAPALALTSFPNAFFVFFFVLFSFLFWLF
jgi:hypothetical protein